MPALRASAANPLRHPSRSPDFRCRLVQLSEYLDQTNALAQDARALLDGLEPDTRVDVAKGQLNALKDDRLAALQGRSPSARAP